jgi:uncharacterized OsmC-like protein
MHITSTVISNNQTLETHVETDGSGKKISIAPKSNGQGSSVNGGELLFLSIATCFCNDIYREAATRELKIDSVEVSVSGHFGGIGEPCSNIVYRTKILSPEHQEAINELINHVDKIAEIHNTLRRGVTVRLEAGNS